VLRGLALRAIPFRLQGSLLRRLPAAAGRLEGGARFGAIDWPRTTAFSEELDYHPSVWINLAGRDAHGTVSPADYDRTRDALRSALVGWRDEAGMPVVERVWRREELYRGPATERAPDLLLELAAPGGYSQSCLRSVGPGAALRRLGAAEHGAGKGAGLNGSHRPDGLFVLAGPGVRPGACARADIVDVLPTLLALGGMAVPEGLDGSVIEAALVQPPRYERDPLAETDASPVPYDDDQSHEVAARLASLGYLEPTG
jgi:predicted AlkP superfamily phosphohydrolase/phosphomutase